MSEKYNLVKIVEELRTKETLEDEDKYFLFSLIDGLLEEIKENMQVSEKQHEIISELEKQIFNKYLSKRSENKTMAATRSGLRKSKRKISLKDPKRKTNVPRFKSTKRLMKENRRIIKYVDSFEEE